MAGPVQLVPTDDVDRWGSACRASGQPITPFHAYPFLALAAGMTRHSFAALIVRHEGADVGAVPWLRFSRGPFRIIDRMPFPYTGPLVPDALLPQTLRALARRARAERAVVQDYQLAPGAHVDPAVAAAAGFELSLDRTYVIDLSRSEDELWSAMHPDARKNIRKVARNGIEIVESAHAEQTLALSHKAIFSHKRLDPGYPDNFPPSLNQLNRDGLQAHWTVARRDHVELGSLLSLLFEGSAVVWVGGVLPEHRTTASNVALCWDSMLWARAQGARTMDLVGLPDPGIERFKRQFGGEIHEYPVLRRFAPGWRGLQTAANRVLETALALKARRRG
jgi:GNAT acetyltransferase-like protein